MASADYNSYVFVGVDSLDTSLNSYPTESGIAYWKQSAADSGYNLDLTGIESLTKCYQYCQLISGGLCWVFR